MPLLLEIGLTLLGIIAPSAILAWAVNRWLVPVSARLTCLLIVLVLVTLNGAVFTSAVPAPLDEVMRGYPYKGVVGEVESRNPVANDVAKQMLPWMQVAREELFAGRAPLWNRYSFSGYPLLGNAQSAPFSPFFLLTLFVPLPKQIVAMAGLKLFVSLLFGVLFLKEEGVGPAAALAGSMAYAFSVIQNVYLYYPMSSVTCLLPALAFAVVSAMRRRARASFVAVALVTAAAFSSGHPETVLHLAIGAGILMALEVVRQERPARVSGLTIGFAVIGVLLAAAVWLPAAQQVLSSERMDALRTGIVESPEFPLQALWAGLDPDGFGNPALGTWRWIFNYPMVATTFVGLIPLALLPGGLFSGNSDRRTRLLVVVAAVLFVVAMRWTLIGELFNQIPILSSSANDRLRFLVVFFVATALARRLSAIARTGPSVIDLAALFTVVVLEIYLFRKLVLVTIPVSHMLLIAMLAMFTAACLAASMSLWKNWKLEGASGLPLMAAIVVGVELFVVNVPYNALTPRQYWVPDVPIMDAVRKAAPDEPWRLVGADWTFLPNASAQYGVEDVRGSDPMAWAPYTRFFARIQAENQSLDVLRVRRVGDAALDFLNVRFLLADPGFEAGEGWTRIYSGPDGELFENEEWVRRFFAPAKLIPDGRMAVSDVDDLRRAVLVADASLTDAIPNATTGGMWMQQMSTTSIRLTVDAPARTFIASSQPALPGWEVSVNDEPVETHLVDGAFIGFWVPEGTSKVHVGYEPAVWKVGLVLSLIGAVALWFASRGVAAVAP